VGEVHLSKDRDILLAGASGLVGSALARLIPAERLISIGRRAAPDLPPGARQIVAQPAEWPTAIAGLLPATAISALGTTIRAAGSKPAFAAIDLDLVVAFARAAQAAGARHFIMVSSVGASAGSSNFYLSTKGKAEAAVRAIGFDRVDILRPGLLRGDRPESRPGERLGIMLSPLTDALTPRAYDKYRSVAVSDVAAAMAALTEERGAGVHVHHHREILALAGV
jgi:uncharacterized protein YbjT (DUF2867 family)